MSEIIKMLERCDGTRKNCEGCMYQEHPACRNAMAKHAAAELSLGEIRLGNTQTMLEAVKGERDYLRKAMESYELALAMHEQMSGRIAEKMYEMKLCETCLHNPEEDANPPEICERCQAGVSEWLLAKELQPDEPKGKANKNAEDTHPAEDIEG